MSFVIINPNNGQAIDPDGNTHTPDYPKTCGICDRTIPAPKQGAISTGYACWKDTDGVDLTVCYPCAGATELDMLLSEGKGMLYLSMASTKDYQELFAKKKHGNFATGMGRDPNYYYNPKVGNWTGHFSAPCYYMKRGYHNIAQIRWDVWFAMPDGYIWHGVQYGHWTQICHVKRTKTKVEGKVPTKESLLITTTYKEQATA